MDADVTASAIQPRVGVLGGTFDPLHIGHLIIATELKHALSLERVLFVPAGSPPHKANQVVTPNIHRLAMLRAALADAPEFEINTVDLDRPQPSFTVETLEILLHQIGPVRLVFLMGEDSLRDLPTWHDPDGIVERAELGVATRPEIDLDISDLYAAVPAAHGRVHLVNVPEIGISSRNLRERVARGLPIRYQVPRGVEDYIVRHRLYLDEPSRESDRDRASV